MTSPLPYGRSNNEHILAHNDKDAVHPDMSFALHNYHRDKTIVSKVIKRREKKLKRQIRDKPLWNHKYDEKLQKHAIYATLDYIAKGHKWPHRKKRK